MDSAPSPPLLPPPGLGPGGTEPGARVDVLTLNTSVNITSTLPLFPVSQRDTLVTEMFQRPVTVATATPANGWGRVLFSTGRHTLH